MSISTDPLDVVFDLRAARRRRLRRFLRIAIPIVTLLALAAAIAGIGAYLYQANREDARLLTDDLLEELERRIVSEVEDFLEPASSMVRLAEEVLEVGALFEQRERLAEPLSMHILESNPQLANFNFADPQGNFMMLRKLPDGSIHTKFMDRRGGGVATSWIRRDPSGRVVAVERDASDTYDPRTRPWYQGAAATGKLYWSDVYVFFTDHRPGITASLPVYDHSGDLAAVYAIDIALEKLSAFLGSLEIGRSGRAMIIDDDGVLVAYPVLEQMVKNTDRGLARAHIEELADPVLNRAFDRFRVDAPGKRELVVEGRRYINTASSLKSALGRDWTLLIVVPEEDFVGFVADNSRRGLTMSLAVLGLASLLAGLLVALIVIGRSATVMITELVELGAGGQIHMLDAQGIDAFDYLVVARIAALAVCSFALGVIFVLTALVAGQLLALVTGVITVGIFEFLVAATRLLSPTEYLILPLKTAGLGVLIGVVACVTALRPSRIGSDAMELVPLGFMRAVVASLILSGGITALVVL